MQTATRMRDMLTEKFEHLVDFPRLGRIRPEYAGGYRSLPADNYVIYYRILEDTIEITRVLHGSADAAQIFEPANGDAP